MTERVRVHEVGHDATSSVMVSFDLDDAAQFFRYADGIATNPQQSRSIVNRSGSRVDFHGHSVILDRLEIVDALDSTFRLVLTASPSYAHEHCDWCKVAFDPAAGSPR